MPIVDLDSAWTNDNVHRFSKFSQISNSSCKSKKNRLNNIFVQFTRCCNWNRVAIYHIEAFLVNGMLTFRFGYFLLSRISQQQLLQLFVRNETRPYFMVVHSFFSLIRQIFCDIKIRVLGRFDYFSVNFKSKSSKISVVDSAACNYLLFDVLSKSSDRKVELGFGVKGLH